VVAQQLAIAQDQLAAAGDIGLERVEPGVQERGARLVEPVVEAEADDVVARGMTAVAIPGAGRHRMRARAAGKRRDVGVAGREQPALAACEDLVREEAERAREPQCAELAAQPGRRRAGRVRRILDQRQASLPAQLAQRCQCGRVAAVVDGAHGLRAWRDAPLHVRGIDPEVVRAGDVGQHRRCAAVAHRRGGGDERHRRHDDLVARPDAGGQVREVKRRGAARQRDRVRHAQHFRKRRLEALRARTHRQPARAQAGRDRVDVALAQADVEHRDVGQAFA
jgi:hypothetical protein